MPISGSEFERGQILPGRLVVEFLSAEPEQAFSLDELWWTLGSKVTDSLNEFRVILSDLEEKGFMRSKVINEMLYFSYAARGLGFTEG